MQSNKAGITALYCRLSRDDGNKESDSNSIENQKIMLSRYAQEKGFENTRFYVDDGFTGTNFNRPDFKRMMEDVEAGYISTIIVKDMSRFGRNYVEVGLYTESYFPENNIRFIAITDLVDSADGENEIIPFKNVMNEMYARDISKKVRSAKRIRGNMGEPLAQPPYGYVKDAINPKKWVIEHEAAEVVRDIFRMCLEGKGNETIARLLQENKVLVPMAYWRSKGLNRGGKKSQEDPYKWCKTTIAKILSQQEYCGDVINFRTFSKSFKNKTRIPNSEENWKVFKNVHEPIIDRETFELVQTMIKKTKRRSPKKQNAEKHLFSGLLRCADCGHNMRYHTNTINKDIHYFSCGNYTKDTRGDCQTRHYIRADAIEAIVILELKHLASYLKNDEEILADILEKKTNKDFHEQRRYIESELQNAISRQQSVNILYEKLYEDNAVGKVTDEWFMHMAHKYETERVTLKSKIADYRTKLATMNTVQQSRDMFMKAVRKVIEIEVLSAPLVRELIDHIDVYETQGKGKNKTQRVVIHYRFVGYIELPTKEDDFYKSDTRQGVQVSYIPRALPESITA